MRVDTIGTDSKATQKILNAVKNISSDVAFMGISATANTENDDNTTMTVLAFATVPQTLIDDPTNDLKADEWVRATLEVCGGRGGGKPQNAQGQAKKCTDVDAVLDSAIAYSKIK